MPIPNNILNKIKDQHNINVYFETGLARGRGVEAALNANFNKIYSIEIYERWINEGIKKYDPSIVKLIHSDSQSMYEHIKEIDERILFFLDAHNDHSNMDGENSNTDCPIEQELNAIKKHHINNHIIVVDDLHVIGSRSKSLIAKGGEFKGRACVNWGKDIQISSIKKKILEINNYKISTVENQLIAEI